MTRVRKERETLTRSFSRDSIKEETHHSKNHPLKCMGKLRTPRWPLFAHVPPLPVPLLQSFCRSYAVTLFATLGIYFQSGGKNQQLERHKQHRLENFDYQRRMVFKLYCNFGTPSLFNVVSVFCLAVSAGVVMP